MISKTTKQGGLVALIMGLVLSLGWSVGAMPPVQAQSTPAWPAGVRIERNLATPKFPEGITFQFKAGVQPGSTLFKRVELAYRLEGEVATSVRRQNFERSDQRTLEAEFVIDTRKNYFPPGSRLVYSWLLTDERGEIYETPRQQIIYQDLRYAFKELKSGPVTVRWYQGDDNFGRTALNKAETAITRLGQLYKIKPDRPINITIYPDRRTMFTALPVNTEDWVGGQAVPELGTIVLNIAPGDLKELGRSLPHEISHQVIYQATRNPYNVPPKWLDEGLAVLNQEQSDGFLQEAFERARDNRTLYPLRTLNGAFPGNSQQSFLAYGQSLQMMRYILTKYGNAAIEKMLASFKQGVSYDEMVQLSLGISLDQLDRDWKSSIGYPLPAIGS